MRIGIEVEYWLVDDGGSLAPATELVAAVDEAETEFVEPLVEIKTPPCGSVDAAIDALTDRVRSVRRAAAARDRHLLPLGTPVTDERVRVVDGSDPRIDIQRAVVGPAFDYARYCAGTHLHFEAVDPLAQLRALTALDPAFSLVNTTPYSRGRRVATCARPQLYRRRCYGDLPSHGQLWHYPDSVAEWRNRREQRYERFLTEAAKTGLDRARVESHFSPDDAVWSPVRLREDSGTVEWRAPDAAPLQDVCRLVTDVTRIVERAVERGVDIGADDRIGAGLQVPPFERLRSHVDAAIERGLSDPGVRAHLAALGVDVDSYRPFGVRIAGDDRVDPDTAERIHRRAVDRLDRDLRELSADGLVALESPDGSGVRSN